MDPLTFSVELEAVYFFTLGPVDIYNDPHLAPVVDMSPQGNPDFTMHDYGRWDDTKAEMIRRVSCAIENCLCGLPQSCRGEVASLEGDPVLSRYQDWKVETNKATVIRDPEPRPEYEGLWKLDLEVQSPMMYATEGSFKEVEAVANMLRASFRAAVPPCCEMRVLVGAGSNLVPFPIFIRIAAICWAVDRFLQQMHPISRHYNRWHGARRQTARLDQAEAVEEAEQVKAIPVEKQDIPILEYVNRARPKRLSTEFKRTLSRNDFNLILFQERNICLGPYRPYLPGRPLTRIDRPNILQGAIQLFGCRSYGAVAYLINHNSLGVYNFNYYSDENTEYKDPKATVEFCTAAGSLDGHWVSTHARICTGIAQFAASAAEENVWRMIYECHDADMEGTEYDLIDLLLDLGLAKEAETVQYRFKMNRNTGEPFRTFLSSDAITYEDGVADGNHETDRATHSGRAR
ncbi:hypothetical protein F5Y00DRAFT_83953 [Daldinia vernicosa]|uniref:uncharacterized protein n=1 Tax=Daldinia vernicosa TaxID=114800 RepID=UPI002008B25C|nr:uncharacterized protein F5Y00DRAFT_83953 [Daldinia vernicosa]KAI0848634.1 hypothetical protein F5Y00DRAFT_83953 [Daldinia vernicosa]